MIQLVQSEITKLMGFCLPHKFQKKEKGTSVKIPKSFAKNATYLIHYKLVLKIKIQNILINYLFI